MSIQVIIGVAILLPVFGGLFIAASKQIGIKEAFITIVLAVGVAAAIALGVFMIVEGFK